jgi:hypothetical protein
MANGSLYQTATGTLASKAVGDRVYGLAIEVDPLVGGQGEFTARGTLGAEVEATAATANVTMTALWQVSKDGSTWIDCANASSNASGVALTTGTATKVTKAIEAPRNVVGYKQVRLAIVVGGTGGSAGDLYKISYTGAAFTGY